MQERKMNKDEAPLTQEVTRENWRSRKFSNEEQRPQERPRPTPEQKAEMDREVVAVGQLMNESRVWWQLDGGFNISLLKGEYIGVHADIDISIKEEDLPKLEEYLLKHGYGLFKIAKIPGPTKKLLRVNATNFHREAGYNRAIIPIDESGNYRKDPNIRFIEVVVVEHNAEGKYRDGWKGATLPEEWLNWKTIKFQGVEIPLSHPAKFFFYKIFFDRGDFDEKDVDEYIKLDVFTKKDLQDLERVISDTMKKADESAKPDKNGNSIIDEETRTGIHALIQKRLDKLRIWLEKNNP